MARRQAFVKWCVSNKVLASFPHRVSTPSGNGLLPRLILHAMPEKPDNRVLDKRRLTLSKLLRDVDSALSSRCGVAKGAKLIVAVSGGVDSMVLLHALDGLRRANQWRLVVAHVNHQLRGRSSEADERLVRKVASALAVPVAVGRVDVTGHAKRTGASIEMAARELRHRFLARVARRHHASAIALAHHADDQVELLLLRLKRGSSGAGLAGMQWKSPSPSDPTLNLVRPFLGTRRAEIMACAAAAKIPFREDASNALLDHERNRVRHRVIPALRKAFAADLAESIVRSMDVVGAEAEFVGDAAESWLRGEKSANFAKLAVAVQRRVIEKQLLRTGLSPEFALIERLRLGVGHVINAERGLRLMLSQEGTLLEVPERTLQPFATGEASICLADGAGDLEFDGCQIRWRVLKIGKGLFRRPQHRDGVEIFDADRIGETIHLRHWRPGDRFQPIGMPRAIKVQDLFVNQKVPRDQRRILTLAATKDGTHFWIEGLRISEVARLSADSRSMLRWEWRRTENTH